MLKADNESALDVLNVLWAPCGESLNDDTCASSFADLGGFENLTSYSIVCSGDLADEIDEDYVLNVANITTNGNGTFCTAAASDLDLDSEVDLGPGSYIKRCELVDYPRVETCITRTGKHSTSFWVYFAIRTVFQWAMNSAYSLQDGTAVHLARVHGSDYSYILLMSQLSATLAPFVTAFAIRDAEEGSGGLEQIKKC